MKKPKTAKPTRKRQPRKNPFDLSKFLHSAPPPKLPQLDANFFDSLKTVALYPFVNRALREHGFLATMLTLTTMGAPARVEGAYEQER